MGKRRRLPVRLVIEIGERDGWLCGICRDESLPITPPIGATSRVGASSLRLEDVVCESVLPGKEIRESARDPLSASIDHIVPVASGGTDNPSNLQISHLYCNLHKNAAPASAGSVRPEYVRAVLANLLDGTPIPEEIYRGCYPSWAYPGRRHTEMMMALRIAAGAVAADPRHGDPAVRAEPFIHELGENRWQDAVAKMQARRALWRERWSA